MLIAGLGNPGKKYSGTRHNAGFQAVAAVGEEYNFQSPKKINGSLAAEGKIEEKDVILVQTGEYMNNSGRSVKKLADYYNISSSREIIIIYDDMDLSPGKIRIKRQGSSGGHKGLESVIRSLGTEKIPRIRIGIGHPPPGIEVMDYVLGRYSEKEKKFIREAISDIVVAVGVICKAGFSEAMNKFN
ncbi:MAG: aminoacyl-tRNA hydrolase [Halanaerobiales bacterium]